MKRDGSSLAVLAAAERFRDVGEIKVNCGSCTACCRAGAHAPVTAAEAEHYTTARHDGVLVLAKRPNGDCIYLLDGKCSIYADRPRSVADFFARETADRSVKPPSRVSTVHGGGNLHIVYMPRGQRR